MWARATVVVLGLSANGPLYLQEVQMKCPKSEEFFEINTQSLHCECIFGVENAPRGAKMRRA